MQNRMRFQAKSRGRDYAVLSSGHLGQDTLKVPSRPMYRNDEFGYGPIRNMPFTAIREASTTPCQHIWAEHQKHLTRARTK